MELEIHTGFGLQGWDTVSCKRLRCTRMRRSAVPGATRPCCYCAPPRSVCHPTTGHRWSRRQRGCVWWRWADDDVGRASTALPVCTL
jgi:hypothetical protein